MADQLVLVPVEEDQGWQIDERHREAGRRGLEQARQALRRARTSRAA